MDATSQTLDWVKQRYMGPGMGIWWWLKGEYDKAVARGDIEPNPELDDVSFSALPQGLAGGWHDGEQEEGLQND